MIVYNLHFNIFLDNGVMTTPKRRILSFVFTVLTLKKSLLIIIIIVVVVIVIIIIIKILCASRQEKVM